MIPVAVPRAKLWAGAASCLKHTCSKVELRDRASTSSPCRLSQRYSSRDRPDTHHLVRPVGAGVRDASRRRSCVRLLLHNSDRPHCDAPLATRKWPSSPPASICEGLKAFQFRQPYERRNIATNLSQFYFACNLLYKRLRLTDAKVIDTVVGTVHLS